MKPVESFFVDVLYPTIDELTLWVYYYVLIELGGVWPEDDWLTVGNWDINIWYAAPFATRGNATIYYKDDHSTGIGLLKGV